MVKGLRLCWSGLTMGCLLMLSGCQLSHNKLHYTTTLEGISLHVPSLTGGIINRMRAEEGAWVQPGDTLAVLDTREIDYQLEQLDASLAELASQLQIAQNNQKQATKDSALAADRLQRAQKLWQAETLAKQSVEDAENALQKAQTLLANASQQVALLTASREKLLAQKKILRKKKLDALILSPASGRVSVLYLHAGEAVSPFGNLMEIVNTKSLQAKVYLPEQALTEIKSGSSATVLSEGGQRFPATVTAISNKAEFTPKTILTPDNRASMVYAVTLTIANEREVLKDGMPVEVEF